ncbi:ABC transporter ATP-binding protein [Microbacterium esteraromaticum]|uniref:dipeptide ABC transporter ATP-binding protein n=1 Tax=Microbacterium esteraromaticum TaxID=57043 RepID=UPI001C9771E7|nr:ABC transporter ATP-binding protein [Microbacterium esteraromaticum]MBY6062413.1 ABC transporter ATP-binding protein [Microbacterium esteraromaticum]
MSPQWTTPPSGDPHREHTDGQTVLDVVDLAVSYGDREVVSAVDFRLWAGETVAIVGESGSGKTTVINAVLGLLPRNARTSGSVVLQGREILGADESEIRPLRGTALAYVPQDPMSNLNPVMRVGNQVAEAASVTRDATAAVYRERAIDALGRAGLDDARERYRLYPHQFSGGMRQRALIAAGVVNAPTVLIADEPTSALDVTVQRVILDNLAELTAESGTAVLLITHDLGLAAERADRVIVMHHGRIVEQGASRDVLFAPQAEYTKALVAAAPFAVASRFGDGERASAAPRGNATAQPSTDTAPALRVDGLSKVYPARGWGKNRRPPFTAVENVSFSIPAGRTLAIAGESGSGKSTTAQMVLQLLRRTSGSIVFQGRDTASLSKRQMKGFRRAVQSIFQDPYASLDPLFSIERSLREPLDAFAIGTPAERDARVLELLDLVQLPRTVRYRTASELSGGQRQRVAIARALAPSPELVVCDEPVSALDVLVQAQILDVLTEAQRELGVSYLFISHDLSVIAEISHDLLVMRRGAVVEHGATADVLGDPQHPYTRELIDAIPGRALFRDAVGA